MNGYIHIEDSDAIALTEIEDSAWINNNAVLIAKRSTIRNGANTLIEAEFTVYNSDFHGLYSERRLAGKHECAPVSIRENVFIGSRVMVI